MKRDDCVAVEPRTAALTVHAAFDRCVRRSPSALAVVDGHRTLTYAELQRMAVGLSRILTAAGVGPDVPVALLAERGVDAVVGILGILKAGGAYVPIAPSDPDARIDAIVRDTAAPVVLCQNHLRERVGMADIVALDTARLATSADCPTGTAPEAGPSNLAAVVYTSGSTGRPKGVEIEHGAILHRLASGYAPRRHDLQKAPLTVGAHFSDLLVPLLSGGPVIFAPNACLTSGRALLAFLGAYETTRMVFVPSQLSALLESGGEAVAALSRLDTVIVGGELLGPELVKTFRTLLPHTQLVNGYGTCEVAGFICMGPVDSPDDITVGTPTPGCEVHILDERLRPVASGDRGELCVGGPRLARGYRHNLSLTSERFVHDPFSESARRLYRAGDVAERLPDGRIRILGRRDFEVKVHGRRVNLNEVESVMEQLPGVRRAIVFWDAAATRGRVVAYVRLHPSEHEGGAAGTLRAGVAARLPPYMVPSQIHFVSDFPLLPNGKIDRTALAAAAASVVAAAPSPDDVVQPLTPTEQALTDAWQELLRVPHVRVTDDFFSLGGDSLDAIRFLLRAEDAGLPVTMDQLQAARSLSALARMIDEAAPLAAEERAR